MKQPDYDKMCDVNLEVAEVLSKVMVKHKMGYQEGMTAIAAGVDNLLCTLADTMRVDRKKIREQFCGAFNVIKDE